MNASRAVLRGLVVWSSPPPSPQAEQIPWEWKSWMDLLNKDFSLGSRVVVQFHKHKDRLCWKANKRITATYQAETLSLSHTDRQTRIHTRKHTRHKTIPLQCLNVTRTQEDRSSSPAHAWCEDRAGRDERVVKKGCRSISIRMEVRVSSASLATLIPSNINRCHPVVIKGLSAGGKHRQGNSDHWLQVLTSSLIHFYLLENVKITRRRRWMSKCEGCQL